MSEITLANIPPRKTILNDKGEKFCPKHAEWLPLKAFAKRKARLCDACDTARIKEKEMKKKKEREMYNII